MFIVSMKSPMEVATRYSIGRSSYLVPREVEDDRSDTQRGVRICLGSTFLSLCSTGQKSKGELGYEEFPNRNLGVHLHEAKTYTTPSVRRYK